MALLFYVSAVVFHPESPLYSWRSLLIIFFDNYICTSLKLTWLDDCKAPPPPPHKGNHSTLTISKVCQGFFFLLLARKCIHSFFKNVPHCWFGHFLSSCYFSDGSVLGFFPPPNRDLLHLYWRLIGLHIGSFHKPNANLLLGINSRQFISVILTR